RPKIAGRDNAPSGPRRRALVRSLRLGPGIDAHSRIASLNGPVANGASRHHLRDGRQALEKAIQELLAYALFEIGTGHAHRENEAIFGLKSEVHVHQLRETAN